MLMLLSVVFVGLAVFVIYKFKRKIPGINVYAQMQNEKDQEMVSPGSQSESMPNVPQREMTPEQLVEEKVDSQPIVTPVKIDTTHNDALQLLGKVQNSPY
ncbi:UNVERIFIED_CONTAM: VPS10 domain-containing receptor SorCS3 [Gekko kuhli]